MQGRSKSARSIGRIGRWPLVDRLQTLDSPIQVDRFDQLETHRTSNTHSLTPRIRAGGVLAAASLAFLLLAIFIPGNSSPAVRSLNRPPQVSSLPPTNAPTNTHTKSGLEWVGVDKLVLFSDEAADSSLEVYSSFHFGFLWARQQIETEIDAVVFQEEGYGW